MSDTNHTNEAQHERRSRESSAAQSTADPRVTAGGRRRSRGSTPNVSPDAAPDGTPRPVRKGRDGTPTFAVTIGDGLTDDELVDRLANLLLAVSCERPAIASASGASSPRAIGGEEPNHGNG